MNKDEPTHDPFMGREELDAQVASGELRILEADECPLSEADDRYQETHYFLSRIMGTYHQPDEFRWNLNAFLQALRNVTFIIQKVLSNEGGFTDWYEPQQEQMRSDELLRKFVEGRNVVVKQGNLAMESRAEIGIFRFREAKLGLSMPVSPSIPSEVILTEHAPTLQMLPEDHPTIGEEYGVKREWTPPRTWRRECRNPL